MCPLSARPSRWSIVGTAMHWALRRTSDNPNFFTFVAKEVKGTEATLQDWDHDDDDLDDLFD